MFSKIVSAIAACACVVNAMSAADEFGEAFYNCTLPASCSVPLEDGGETCATNGECCVRATSPPAFIQNDPRDSCKVMQLLCERGVDVEASSFARCHAYLSGETTYTPGADTRPADCDYKCDEIAAGEEATSRRRRQSDIVSDDTVSVSLADCQWVFDALQVERGSQNRGTNVTVAYLKGGIDIAHEVMPPLEQIKRVCKTATDDYREGVEQDRGDGTWSVPEMKINCTTDNSVEEFKRVVYPTNIDDKTTGDAGFLFAPRSETGFEGLIPDAYWMHYKMVNSYMSSYNDWLYNAVRDAIDNGAEVLMMSLNSDVLCFEEVTAEDFVPTADPPLPYWSNFTAEQNATWPTQRMLQDIAEYDALLPAQQEVLLTTFPEAMLAYNIEWEKENAAYQADKAVYVEGVLKYSKTAMNEVYQLAYDNDVFIVQSIAESVQEKEKRGLTQCESRYVPTIERSKRPYRVGALDPTLHVFPGRNYGADEIGVDAVVPGGDLFFAGSAPPDLQPVLGVMSPTTCQYRVMWTETESQVQVKPNYYEFNMGGPISAAAATAVAVTAVQAIKARGEQPTVLKVDEELKKYMIQPTWCEATESCADYGKGILTMKVQA